MKTPQAVWKKTEGYKTKTGAILYLLFQLFKTAFPDTLNESSEEVIKYSIDLIILTGGADWAWRNRKKVILWISNLFTKNTKTKLKGK